MASWFEWIRQAPPQPSDWRRPAVAAAFAEKLRIMMLDDSATRLGRSGAVQRRRISSVLEERDQSRGNGEVAARSRRREKRSTAARTGGKALWRLLVAGGRFRVAGWAGRGVLKVGTEAGCRWRAPPRRGLSPSSQ
jgi:hypothetical protein